MFTHYSLDTLLGHSLTAIGRAADLVWWIFDVDGAEYSLHTQCTFRVLHDGEAVLSRSDIYCIRDDKPAWQGQQLVRLRRRRACASPAREGRQHRVFRNERPDHLHRKRSAH